MEQDHGSLTVPVAIASSREPKALLSVRDAIDPLAFVSVALTSPFRSEDEFERQPPDEPNAPLLSFVNEASF